MDTQKPSHSRTLRIVNELGLHARSAAKLAQIAGEAEGRVWITRNGETVDATSILEILTLAVPKGAEITVSVEEDADRNTLERMIALIGSGFGE